MRKSFIFFTLICLLVGVETFAQATMTAATTSGAEAPRANGVSIGGGIYIATSTEDGESIISTTPVGFSGPRGVREIREKIYYTSTPEKPRLGDAVTLKVEMTGTPIKNAEFAWILNSKTVLRGVGRSSFEFNITGKTNVTVLILTQEGNIITKLWSFDPKNTLIIWEAGTYTPPFYKGKSLYTPESTLGLHAINLDVQNPLTNSYANYVWQVDGKVKGNDSGVGKSSFVYKGDLLVREPLFRVDFSGVRSYSDTKKSAPGGGTVSGSAILRVQTKPTTILTYEKTPLLGVLFNKPLVGNFSLAGSETTLVAYPTYFSLNSSLGATYRWAINSNTVGGTGNSLSFKKVRSNELSKLTVDIENRMSLLQSRDISYIIDTSSKSPELAGSLTGFGK